MPSLWPKGVREILECLHESKKRFNQLAAIKVGSSRISRQTLADRLLILVEEELVKRTVMREERPPLVFYEITDRGRRLLKILKERPRG